MNRAALLGERPRGSRIDDLGSAHISHPPKRDTSAVAEPRAAAGPPRLSDVDLGALAHRGSDAVEPLCLGRSPHWPVLTRPRLAGFQVSTEGQSPDFSPPTNLPITAKHFIGEAQGELATLAFSRLYAVPAGLHTFAVQFSCQGGVTVAMRWLTVHELR